MKPEIAKLVRDHVALDEEISALIAMALCDLYDGPLAAGHQNDDGVTYPGFLAACDRIRAALPTADVWVNTQVGYAQDSEPEWTEPCYADECDGYGCDECDEGRTWVNPEDWTQLDARAVREALVGKELTAYL
jgi:hypothetical protein